MGNKMTGCDVINLFKLLGKKWTIELLHNIDSEPVTFNQLFALFGSEISPILLSNRLKELQEFGFIEKKGYQNKLVYCITKMGEELKKSLSKSKTWLKQHDKLIPKECSDSCVKCIKERY